MEEPTNIEDYERTGQAIYASFAETVAAIVIAAIKAEGGYRLLLRLLRLEAALVCNRGVQDMKGGAQAIVLLLRLVLLVLTVGKQHLQD